MNNVVNLIVPNREKEPEKYNLFLKGMENVDELVYIKRLKDGQGFIFGNTAMSNEQLVYYYHNILGYIQSMLRRGNGE